MIDNRSFDLSHIVLDNTALKRAIDWTPRISLRDGIKKIIEASAESIKGPISKQAWEALEVPRRSAGGLHH